MRRATGWRGSRNRTVSRFRRNATGWTFVPAINVGAALQHAMRGIEANPDTLYGVFGDAQWTSKERLSDGLLRAGHFILPGGNTIVEQASSHIHAAFLAKAKGQS